MQYGRITSSQVSGMMETRMAAIIGQSSLTDRTVVDLLEEIVALVIDEDEGGEILDGDFPDGSHAEFGKCDDLLRPDVILGEKRRRATRGAEVEATVFLAGIGD